jgi:hypothetical protein
MDGKCPFPDWLKNRVTVVEENILQLDTPSGLILVKPGQFAGGGERGKISWVRYGCAIWKPFLPLCGQPLLPQCGIDRPPVSRVSVNAADNVSLELMQAERLADK